jgi:hypothetical protein
MQTDNVMGYHGCEVRPVVTATGKGRRARHDPCVRQ